MDEQNEYTRVRVSTQTRDRLRAAKTGGDSYEDVISSLLAAVTRSDSNMAPRMQIRESIEEAKNAPLSGDKDTEQTND